MKKSVLIFIISSVLFILISLGVLFTLTVLKNNNGITDDSEEIEETTEETIKKYTVIIDAGHGGEDGGTKSQDGILEKDLNLDIAKRIKIILEKNNINVVMTREDDTLLYDRNTDYFGKKKLLDMQARLNIAEEHNDAVFVSIHQNYFKESMYSGLQVWYSGNNSRSLILAEAVQSKVKTKLQPNNERKTKLSGSDIYLLHNISSPAILIECGFLSNKEEAARLSDESYRQNLSQIISDAIKEFLENNQ